MAMRTDEAVKLVETMRDAKRALASGYRSRGLGVAADVYDEEAQALDVLLGVVARIDAAMFQLEDAKVVRRAARP